MGQRDYQELPQDGGGFVPLTAAGRQYPASGVLPNVDVLAAAPTGMADIADSDSRPAKSPQTRFNTGCGQWRSVFDQVDVAPAPVRVPTPQVESSL